MGLLDQWGTHSAAPAQAPGAPAQAPASGGAGILGRIGPMMLMMSGDPASAKVGATLLDQGQARDEQSQTMRYMVSKGVDANAAQIMARDPAAVRSWIEKGMQPWQFKSIFNDKGEEQNIIYNPNNPSQYQTIGGPKKATTGDITEYEYAKQQGFQGDFPSWMEKKRSVTGEYGLSPVRGTGPDGKPAIVQLGKSGNAISPKLPEGFQVAHGVEKIDAGTEWILYDKQTGTPIGRQPKNIMERESQEEIGKSQGKAKAELPASLIGAEQTNKKIDELLKHEGLDSIVGPVDQYRRGLLLGARGRDALARYDQLKGSAFLESYNMLRGGGAITEMEGQKATDAMARMDRAQDEADFRQALRDFRDAVDVGIRKLKARAGVGGSAPAAPAAAPAAGPGIDDLLKKYGK